MPYPKFIATGVKAAIVVVANISFDAKLNYQAAGSQLMEHYNVSDNRSLALQVRAKWMRKMGVHEDEIAVHCADDGSPISLEEELEHLRAGYELDHLTPPVAVLKSIAYNR